jgi:hypothetical protein
MEYRHTQLGWIVLAAIAVAVIFLFATADAARSIHVIPVLLVIAILSLFYSLTVEIKDGALKCHFGPGVIRRRFFLSEIEGAQSVRNPWYAGWGIRWRPGRYVLWNVSGFQAVELVLKNGKRFRIGTTNQRLLSRLFKRIRLLTSNER